MSQVRATSTDRRLLAFSGAGLVCAGLVIGYLMTGRIAEAFHSSHWPRTQATISKAAVNRLNRDNDTCWASIEYRYAVDSISYTGTRVTLHDAGGTLPDVQARLRLYRPGSMHDVYYDPRHPARSVLEPSEGWGHGARLLLLPILLLAGGVGLVGAAILTGKHAGSSAPVEAAPRDAALPGELARPLLQRTESFVIRSLVVAAAIAGLTIFLVNGGNWSPGERGLILGVSLAAAAIVSAWVELRIYCSILFRQDGKIELRSFRHKQVIDPAAIQCVIGLPGLVPDRCASIVVLSEANSFVLPLDHRGNMILHRWLRVWCPMAWGVDHRGVLREPDAGHANQPFATRATERLYRFLVADFWRSILIGMLMAAVALAATGLTLYYLPFRVAGQAAIQLVGFLAMGIALTVHTLRKRASLQRVRRSLKLLKRESGAG